jgi:hypothetical protein
MAIMPLFYPMTIPSFVYLQLIDKKKTVKNKYKRVHGTATTEHYLNLYTRL